MAGSADLVVIGGGNMARAIVRGGLDAGLIAAARTIVVEPDAAKRRGFEGWGVRATADHGEAVGELEGGGRGVLLLAVKPQSLREVGAQMRAGGIGDGREVTVVSILAGVTMERVRAAVGIGETGAVIRAMPNTGAFVRKSVTAFCAGEGTANVRIERVERLFSAVGEVVRVEERLMDAFTALAGSGPAYIFYLAEAMVRAGVEMGFDEATADRAVRATIAGAAGLLESKVEESPAALRAAVTSKGGTTEAAVGVLEQRGVAGAIVEAIIAGRDRGRELAL